MEVNEQNLAQLRALFLQTLVPDNNARKEAEKFLESSEVQQGFSLVVLHMISILAPSTNPQDVAIRQSASVLFKNLVKRRWSPEDNEEPRIPQSDRTTIKQHLVDLMCTTPPDVQRQLAEAVSIVSKYDFPDQWQNLLPNLVSKLAANDVNVTKGVMLTANSIMKRFRYVYKSDELYTEIIFCLKGFQVPLLEVYTSNGLLIEALSGDKAKLAIALETQRLMTRIFFSLNWQELPEFFEDNIRPWMGEFGKWLVYKNPAVEDASEESEPGPIEKLQAAIVENLNLYATKYEEEFSVYLPEFTKVVWQLLLGVGSQPKFDILATSSIKFLTTVSSKQANIGLFTDDILREIIEHIVVRNLTATENDEELFEDNPTDYIRKDMEGSDQDTRRRSACELVRGLLKFFSAKTSQLCVTYIGAMLEQYRASMDWRAKDAALHLFLAVAVMSKSANLGAGELNPNVNILEIFNSHVLSEVHDANVNARPIVKADAIKMICIFRSHLQAPFMLSLLPDIIRHLNSKYVVIQTYAALCIERFLTVKDRDAVTNQQVSRVTKEHLMEYLQPLFSGLFAVLENRDLPENDYVMKCIMRVLSLVGSGIAPVTELVLNHLTQALERVCRNPANPHFNHYLFECLALLVRSACNVPSADQAIAACTKFEALLFPPFQAVLSQDVVEFVPYVFQILAQLLSARPGAQSGLSPSYLALFPPLLSPTLWERKGNIPALTDLYRAYISKGMKEILAGSYLTGVLGVFQKLLASKATDQYAFKLLDSLVFNNQYAALSPFIPTILNLLLHRMQEQMKDSKTPKYCRHFIHTISIIAAVYGGAVLEQAFDGLEKGLINMLILQVWSVNRANTAAADKPEVKQMIIGGTRILTETSIAKNPEAFGSLLKSLVALLSAGTGKGAGADFNDEFLDEEADAREFDSTYSKLAYAHVTDTDPTAEIASPSAYFASALSSLSRAAPGQYTGIIASALDEQEKSVLQTAINQAGVSL